MSPLKSQVKIGTINDLGVKYDDMRESAEKDILRKEGYHVALNELQQSTLKSVFERIDTDREEGKLDLEAAAHCKEYVLKVHSAVDNLRIMNEKHRLIAEGRVIGLREAIAFAAKVMDAEKAKLQAAEGQMEVAEGGVREVRPDAQMSALEDLDQRRASSRAAKEALVAAVVVPLTEEQPPTPTVTSAAPVNGARRGRPPKAKGQDKEARG